jgi:hypothetical protein
LPINEITVSSIPEMRRAFLRTTARGERAGPIPRRYHPHRSDLALHVLRPPAVALIRRPAGTIAERGGQVLAQFGLQRRLDARPPAPSRSPAS